MERVVGIEPTPSAWKAEVLPLNYTRQVLGFYCEIWWRGKDSNLRRLSRQIYSLIPLTAREPLRKRGAIFITWHRPVNTFISKNRHLNEKLSLIARDSWSGGHSRGSLHVLQSPGTADIDAAAEGILPVNGPEPPGR